MSADEGSRCCRVYLGRSVVNVPSNRLNCASIPRHLYIRASESHLFNLQFRLTLRVVNYRTPYYDPRILTGGNPNLIDTQKLVLTGINWWMWI